MNRGDPRTTGRPRSRPASGGPSAPAASAGDVAGDAEWQILGSPAIDHWEPGAARNDAEVLLAHAMRVEPEALDPEARVPTQSRRRFDALVHRRIGGEPVALILGYTDFRGLRLRTRRGVFTPRGSSEFHAGEVIRRMRRRRGGICVDVAAGAGPVALAAAHEVPDAEVWGLDIDPAATALCRSNARRLGLTNTHFATGDLLGPLPRRLRGRVEVIAIHPPYVAAGDMDHLPEEIRRYEPAHTLTDRSDDGLEMVRRLASEAPECLARTGRVYVEIGASLSRRTQTIFRRHGYRSVIWVRDAGGLTRVVIASRPRS